MSSLINLPSGSSAVLFSGSSILRVSAVWRTNTRATSLDSDIHDHSVGFGYSRLLHVDGPLADEYRATYQESLTSEVLFVVSSVVTLAEFDFVSIPDLDTNSFQVSYKNLTAHGRLVVDTFSEEFGAEATLITELLSNSWDVHRTVLPLDWWGAATVAAPHQCQ